MTNKKFDDKKLKKLFRELEDVTPDLSKKITRRIFWEKFRFSFALHFLVFVVLLAALPFSYRSVAGDFVRYEIIPMLNSILSNFEFSFDFITYQINFVSAFLPVGSLLVFSFNIAVFCLVSFFIFRDFKNLGFINNRKMERVMTGVFLVFFFFVIIPILCQPVVLAQSSIEANSSFDKAALISPFKDAQDYEVVLTGIISEVNIEMSQLIIELRTTNKKELFDLRGEKIFIYTDEETEFVKRGIEEARLIDLKEGDRVTIIGTLDETIFWAGKIVAATPWWKKLFK